MKPRTRLTNVGVKEQDRTLTETCVLSGICVPPISKPNAALAAPVADSTLSAKQAGTRPHSEGRTANGAGSGCRA